MSNQDEILKIERERLKMEKLRDKHASFRFLVGSVLLGLFTTGASFYLNDKQDKRAVVNSERQWIIPMLFNLDAADFDSQVSLIDELQKINLSQTTKEYLASRKVAATKRKNDLEKIQKEKREAERVAKQQKEAALLAENEEKAAAKERAKVAAQKAKALHLKELRFIKEVNKFGVPY